MQWRTPFAPEFDCLETLIVENMRYFCALHVAYYDEGFLLPFSILTSCFIIRELAKQLIFPYVYYQLTLSGFAFVI